MKKRHTARTVVIIILLATIIIFAAVDSIAGNGFLNSLFTDVREEYHAFLPIGVQVSYDQKSGASFYTHTGGKGFYFATKDGIQYLSADGRMLMNESYTTQNPILFGEGRIAAITEQNGHYLYVYSPDGLMYTAQFENPIVNVYINTLGMSSVVTKKTGEYEVFVHNARGELQQKGVFPDANTIITSTAISNDGRIWAVAFLDISGAQINSQIGFYYLNKSEAGSYADSMFASINDSDNQYFGIMRFMDGGLIVISNKTIFCVDPGSGSVKPKWTMELNNEISAVCFERDYFAVAYGKGLLNKNAVPTGRVDVYDINLNLLAWHEADERVISLTAGYQSVIIGCGRNFYAISSKGVPLWTYSATFDVKSVLPLDNSGKIIVQSPLEANVMKLTKVTAGPDGSASADEMGDE